MKGKTTSQHPLIESARGQVQEAFANFQRNATRRNEEKWKRSKQKFQETYRDVEEEELDNLIKQVEQADDQNRHRERWKLINKISGRKIVKQGIVKGRTKEERVQKWFSHFQNLHVLGKN